MKNIQIAAYQPDIAQNVGSLIRLSACFAAPLHIIEPCGFILDDKRMRRVAMDYLDVADITRHVSWQAFLDFRQVKARARVILLSTHASESYTDFAFAPDDILLVGRESAGVPQEVREAVDAAVHIAMNQQARSLNVALAAGIVLSEAIRQTKGKL